MQSVQTLLADSLAPPNVVQRGHGKIAAGLSLFKQPEIGFEYDDLIGDIRTAHAEHFVADNRPGMACIVLLAHHLKLISKADIDSAVKSPTAFYTLHKHSINLISSYLDGIGREWAGKGVMTWEFTPVHVSMTASGDSFYICVSSDMRLSEFNLKSIEADIANLVFGCLSYILRDLGFGLLPDDLPSLLPMLDEELFEYEVLRKQNEDKSVLQLAEYALDYEHTVFSEYYSDAESLSERLDFLGSIMDTPVESVIGARLTMQEISCAFNEIKRTERHRMTNPWMTFIRKTLIGWKGRQKSVINELNPGDVHSDYETVPLDYAQAVGIGLGWEYDLVDSLYQGMYESGESAAEYFRLSPDTVPALADKLTALAQARGLLRCAEMSNELIEKRHETRHIL